MNWTELPEALFGAAGWEARAARPATPPSGPAMVTGWRWRGRRAANLAQKKQPHRAAPVAVRAPAVPHANLNARRDTPTQAGPQQSEITRVFAGAVVRREGGGEGAGAEGDRRGRL